MLDMVGSVLSKAARRMVIAWTSTPPIAPEATSDLKDMDHAWYDRMRCFLYGVITGTYLGEVDPEVAKEMHAIWQEMFKDSTERSVAVDLLRQTIDDAIASVTGGKPEDMPDA
jgi:hypothetical protein